MMRDGALDNSPADIFEPAFSDGNCQIKHNAPDKNINTRQSGRLGS